MAWCEVEVYRGNHCQLQFLRATICAATRGGRAHQDMSRLWRENRRPGPSSDRPAHCGEQVPGRAQVLEHLAAQIEKSQQAGRVDGHLGSAAAAAAMGAILERLAAYHRELELLGVTRDDLVETCARILHQTVAGSA